MDKRTRTSHVAAAAALLLALGACKPQQSHMRILAEAAAPVFDFPTECPASAGMDACRAKLAAFPVGFGTERDRTPAQGANSQRVLIIAYQGTKDIKASAPPAKSTLILHLSNHGKLKTALYDLDPSSQADYYVTVQDVAGTAGWTLWRVPTNNNGSVSNVTGTFAQCQPPAATQWSYSIADFASCANAPHLQGVAHASLADFLVTPLHSLLLAFRDPPPLDDPGWFSCDGGCCTM